MELSCPFGSHIINPLLTKPVPSRWLEISLVLVLRVYGPRLRFWSINRHEKKENLANIKPYYLASSVTRQDEPNHVLRLATRAGKMELSCPLGFSSYVVQKIPRKPYNEYFINRAFSVKIAAYWPRSFFAS